MEMKSISLKKKFFSNIEMQEVARNHKKYSEVNYNFFFRFKMGGKEMFFRMARDQRYHKPKMVILSHDIAHRPYEKRDEQKELETFIKLAKNAGYKFDTIDNYL